MKLKKKLVYIAALMVFVIPFAFTASNTGAMYLTDGTKEVLPGVYENPNDGMCIVGVAANGDMLVDTSITNARDCVAYTTGLTGMTTSAQCTTAGGAGNDGYRHTWATTNTCVNAANPTVAISLVDLDRTLAMCISKGGTTLTTTGTCVAYGWQYRNRKADGTVPVVANTPTTTKGVVAADNLGFCYAPVRMTLTGVNDSATTCPSYHNSATTAPAEWPACASNAAGCQTQASYDAGLGWSFASSQCIYAYGVTGYANAAITRANGTTYAAGAAINPSAYTTQGDCLAQGFSWDNWLPITATSLVSGVSTTLGNTNYRKFDTTTPVASGGGQFHSGTGAVCTKCHSDQSRAYMERNKAAYFATGHKKAGDDPAKPWTTNFTAANSDWGMKGVQCNICHGTARPGQNDLLQVSSTVATAGNPKYASGHQNLALGTAATQLCFECHGTPASGSSNPASIIPVSSGEFSMTDVGLAPIANQFLNSPHGKYTGDSVPLSLITKANYATTFVGYNCRTAANGSSYVTTVYQTGQVGLIHFLDSTINSDCTNAGNGSATSGAAGFWQKEGSNIDSATAMRTDAGNCTTCHDVHWSLDSTETHAEPLRRECTTCHIDPASQADSASGAKQADLIRHPGGAGTPGTGNHACETCHMPKLTADGSFMHLWSISTNPDYVTAGATQANADTDGKIKVDLGNACGQCHKTGGTAFAIPNGQLAAGAAGMHAGSSFVCTSCHAITPANHHHASVCTTCHDAGAPDGRARHDGTAPLTTNASCLTCHDGSTSAPEINQGVDHHIGTCATCHTEPGVGLDTTNATCLTCHDGSPGPLINQGVNHHTGTCTTCHANPGIVPANCASCHTSNNNQALINHPNKPLLGTPDCGGCHSAGGFIPTVLVCNVCHGGSAGPGSVSGLAPFLSASKLAKILKAGMHRNVAPVASMSVVVNGMTADVTDTSTDADGNIASVVIDWGDNTKTSITPGSTASHTYTKTGKKTITLTVTDSRGVKAKVKTKIVVPQSI